MRLQLVVDVPSSADQGATLAKLAWAMASEQGITITTSDHYSVDVDLVLLENMGTPGEASEVVS